MATLTLPDEVARKIYPGAAPELKTILENSFEKNFFSENITDRVKNMDDVCRLSGWTDSRAFYISCERKEYTADEVAYKEAKMITAVLNEGWIADWTNLKQYKYVLYFNMNPSAFGLHGVGFFRSYSGVASRLCFRDDKLARYAATTFPSTFKTLFTY